jgi:O-succinylbenzoic acid--CoA ligase
MNNSWFELNGKQYDSQQLIDGNVQASTDFEKSTLSFCRDWLRGKKEFTLTTSGSTGVPKPITLRREQMEANAWRTIEALQLKAQETALICLDTKYIAGQMMLVRSFLAGMNMLTAEPVGNPFKRINDHRVDFAAFVPLQVDAILAEGHMQHLDEMKCAIIGGAQLSESLKRKLRDIKSLFFATYGMTETVSHIALQKLNGDDSEDSFRILGNTKISKDERGCLIIDADYLDEKVITNDLVNIVDSSHFTWIGRIDNVINSGGVKISAESIENVVESIFEEENLANRFFVAGIPDDKLGQRVTLFVEGSFLGPQMQDHVLKQLSIRVSKFEIPKEIKFVSKFSETGSGKVNRMKTIARSEV